MAAPLMMWCGPPAATIEINIQVRICGDTMGFWRRRVESERRVDAALNAIEKSGGSHPDAPSTASDRPALPPAREPEAEASTDDVSTRGSRDETRRAGGEGVESELVSEDGHSVAREQDQPTHGADDHTKSTGGDSETTSDPVSSGTATVPPGPTAGPPAYEQALRAALAEADVMAERITELRQRVAEMQELIREGEAERQNLLDLADLLRQSVGRTQPPSAH